MAELEERFSQLLADPERTQKAGDAAPGGAALPAAAGSAMEQSPLAALLPQLMTLFSGQGDLVKSERLDLLRAMKPYLKESRISSIDRAVKMANMTKAAASAMHLLGR